MDLREWMRPDRGKALLELIEQCPDSCRWREAVSLDVELMREVTPPDEGAEWRPRLSEMSLTNYLLLELVNLTGVQVQGKSLKDVTPLKPPLTAKDLLRLEDTTNYALDLIAQITPHALKGGRPDG